MRIIWGLIAVIGVLGCSPNKPSSANLKGTAADPSATPTATATPQASPSVGPRHSPSPSPSPTMTPASTPTPTPKPPKPTPTPTPPIPPASPTPSPYAGLEYKDMVTAGYQAWFTAPGDGSALNNWNHWAITPAQAPAIGNVHFDLYPDLTEYNSSDLYQTNLPNFGNGKLAKLYSAQSQSVIDLHFKWLNQYGIDGVDLGRFTAQLSDPKKLSWRNDVAKKVRNSAEKWGRYFYIRINVVGHDNATVVQDVKNDLVNELENKLKIFNSPYYARSGGKPVLLFWGLGFSRSAIDQANATNLIQFFKSRGYFVVGGVPFRWRDGDGDAKPGWIPVYQQLDMIQPWSVGRFRTDAEIDGEFYNRMMADKAFCNLNNISYQPVLWPGFSWSNWQEGAPQNGIPRRGGDHLWHQAYQIARVGVRGARIAMLDEYDEGTAIAKVAPTVNQIPQGQFFVTLDIDGYQLPSDFYLQLSGEAIRMIRGQRSLTYTNPLKP